MEIREFIKTSMVDICGAIEDSNAELKEQGSGAVVNPGAIVINSDSSQAYGRESSKVYHVDKRVVQKIDFDIAVVVDQGTSTGGGVKISVASIGLGAEGKSTSSASSETRLKFAIPIIYPEINRYYQKETTPEEEV